MSRHTQGENTTKPGSKFIELISVSDSEQDAAVNMTSKLSIHERFAQTNNNKSSYAAYSRAHTEPALASGRSPRLTTSVLDNWAGPSPILEGDDGAEGDEKEEVLSIRSARSGQGQGRDGTSKHHQPLRSPAFFYIDCHHPLFLSLFLHFFTPFHHHLSFLSLIIFSFSGSRSFQPACSERQSVPNPWHST